MQPVDLVRRSLGADAWSLACTAWAEDSVLRVDESRCILPTYDVSLIRGATNQFDFPMLPNCLYGYFAANGREAFRLTRNNKEIERLLEADWESLLSVSTTALAALILPFYESGISESHRVIQNVLELEAMCKNGAFEFDPKEQSSVAMKNAAISTKLVGDSVEVRVLTLRGWMHTKSNLGIETISIGRNGHVTLAEREVWSEKLFRKFPGIKY